MNTCKFFLQGICKFGDNCKFSHQIIDTSAIQGSSIMRQQNSKPPTIDTSLLVKSVITDMTNAEKGGHWLLSSYAPFKDKPCFPGFENRSFEEVRWAFYESTKNGTLEQFKQQLQIALQEAAMKMKALQNPSNDIVAMLVQIYNTPVANQNVSPNSFSSQQTNPVFGQNQPHFSQNQQQSSSIFAVANQNLFGNTTNQQQSMFGGTQTNSSNTNAINQQQTLFGNSATNSNVFGANSQQNANKSMFGGQNLFNNQQTFGSSSNNAFVNQNTSPFVGQNTTNTQNTVFGGQSATKTQNLFGGQNLTAQNSPFGGQATTTQNNPFGAQNSPFGGQNTISTQNSPFGGGLNTISTQSSPFGTGQNTISTQSSPFVGGLNTISTQSSPFGTGQNTISTQSSPFGTGQNTISTQSSPFGSGQTTISSQSSAFGGGQNTISTQSTPFGGGQTQNSFFGQQNTTFTSPMQNTPFQAQNPGNPLFHNQGQPNPMFNSQNQQSDQSTFVAAATTSPFGQPIQQQQSMFGANTMKQSPAQNATPFQAQQQNTGNNVYNAALPSAPIFADNATIFGSQSGNTVVQKPQTSIFGQSTMPLTNSVFGAANTEIIDSGTYSKLEDLSESEIKSFQSDAFEFGKIPEKPPTAQMCN